MVFIEMQNQRPILGTIGSVLDHVNHSIECKVQYMV